MKLGTGVKRDYTKAEECFRKAAELGHVLAEDALKELMEKGKSTTPP